MQKIILNTRNLSVIEAPVNDIILASDAEEKLKIAGVELGKKKTCLLYKKIKIITILNLRKWTTD